MADPSTRAVRESVATKADLLALEQRLTIRMGVVGAAIVALLASLKFFG